MGAVETAVSLRDSPEVQFPLKDAEITAEQCASILEFKEAD